MALFPKSSTRAHHEPEQKTGRDYGRTPAAHEIDWTDPNAVDDDLVVDFVVGQYDSGKQRREQWEAEAAEQLAWARGNQNLVWDEEARDLIKQSLEDKPLEFRNPIYINKLKPFVLTYLGFVIGQPLTWEAQPATREDDDVASARVLSKLLDYYFRRTGTQETTRRMIDLLWMVSCTGIGFIKPTWDPYLGEADRFTAAVLGDKDTTTESRRQRKKLKQRFREFLGQYGETPDDDDGIDLPTGDLLIEFPNGFDVTEPEYSKDIGGCAWLIESRYRTLEYVRERYGEAAKYVTADADSQAYRYRRYEQYGRYQDSIGRASSFAPSEEVMVHEAWRPVSRSAPRGFLAVVADGRVMKKGPHPYLHGKLPYIRITEMPDPDYFRPGCTVRDLMPIQRAINTHRSMLHGHLQTTVDPRMISPKNAGLPDDAFSRGPKHIQVKTGTNISDIRALEMPSPPSYMLSLDAADREDMESVAGVHRSTQGKAESSSQSAKHASLMAQQDARRLSVMRLIVEEGFAAAGQQVAMLLWEFVSATKTVTITGANRKSEVVTFKGKDLSKNKPFGPFSFNVRVYLGAEPDQTMVVERVAALTKAGFLRPDNDHDKQMVLRWLGQEVPSETDDIEIHRHNAAMENHDIANSVPMRAAYGDDDAVHLHEHEMFTTTPEYRTAIKRGPRVDEIMRLHIRHHMYNAADKEFRPIALAKQVQAKLINEYGLMPPAEPGKPGGGRPAPPGGGGQRPSPGPPRPVTSGPPGGAPPQRDF